MTERDTDTPETASNGDGKQADSADASSDEATMTDGAGLNETQDAGSAVLDDDGSSLVGYVEWAAFVILCLLALVATFRFYFAASTAIEIWFNRDFVPIFQAVFNLVVLLACGIGISLLVRRLR